MQTVTSRSSALFGVFYTNDALLSLLLLSFKGPLILFCSTPIKGVLNARAAPRVRREQFFVFVPAERKAKPEPRSGDRLERPCCALTIT